MTNSPKVTTLVTVNADKLGLPDVLDMIVHQAGLTLAYGNAVGDIKGVVSLQVRQVPVADALEQALRGTGLTATISRTGHVLITRSADGELQGGITGTVRDAKSGTPLANATLSVDGASKGVMTSALGQFSITGLAAGSHTVTIRHIGYARQAQRVTIEDDSTLHLDVALQVTATALDQVVVTGTVIPTELKAVPNAITVISAKDIEQRGITHIDQLFHGDVPGLFALNRGSTSPLGQVIMYSRGAVTLPPAPGSSISVGTETPIKTYVDGVELSDPTFLNQIDPRSIERIEILTGPQASTIYGSNAINGVMQIFTKRGTSHRPQLTLNLLSGLIQSNFSSALTPQHDYSAQVAGVDGQISYNAGGTWSSIGAWTPASQQTNVGGYGGLRVEYPTSAGRISADATFRRASTRSFQRGQDNEFVTHLHEIGWDAPSIGGNTGYTAPATFKNDGQTFGAMLSYAPTSWWSNELQAGQDGNDNFWYYTSRGYVMPYDSTLIYTEVMSARRSLRLASTVSVPLTSLAKATVTAGADEWQNLTTNEYFMPQSLTGNLSAGGAYSMYTRQPAHNAGAFMQSQAGILDRLFFTYGLRAEWNPTYGAQAEPNYAPRYGVALTQDIGPLTAKLRASYGRSTRPPTATEKLSRPNRDDGLFGVYGNYDETLGNPELGPEYQQGGEGGLELYLGNRASLVVTRYNQTVNGLITAIPKADSVRSLQPNPTLFGRPCSGWSFLPSVCLRQDAQGYWYAAQAQNVNVGSIRNQGWEVTGTVNTGPLTTKGIYTWSKSRMIGVTDKYRDQFPINQYPQFQVGATFSNLPEHTMALGITYAAGKNTVALNLNRVGQQRIFGNKFSLQYLSGAVRLQQNVQNILVVYEYPDMNQGYTLADLNISRRFSSVVEGMLQLQNLTNNYSNDFSDISAVMGRQTKGGLRIHL